MIRALEKVYGTLPNKAATLAVNFFKKRFVEQNWIDNSTQAWKRRKEAKNRKRSSRATLTKSGRLRRSVRKIRVPRKTH